MAADIFGYVDADFHAHHNEESIFKISFRRAVNFMIYSIMQPLEMGARAELNKILDKAKDEDAGISKGEKDEIPDALSNVPEPEREL